MATVPSKKIGRIKCDCCGEEFPVKQNDQGTLNLSCPWCNQTKYAKAGTQAYSHAMRQIIMDKAEEKRPAAEKLAPVVTGKPDVDQAKQAWATIFG